MCACFQNTMPTGRPRIVRFRSSGHKVYFIDVLIKTGILLQSKLEHLRNIFSGLAPETARFVKESDVFYSLRKKTMHVSGNLLKIIK